MKGLFSYFKRFFIRKELKHEELNVVNSMANAKKLYKELIIKAHPDKHPDNVELAQSLTESINNNRYDYDELLNLKTIIEKEL